MAKEVLIDLPYYRGLVTAGALECFEFDNLTLLQIRATGLRDGRVVDIYFRSTMVVDNDPESLNFVEPLNPADADDSFVHEPPTIYLFVPLLPVSVSKPVIIVSRESFSSQRSPKARCPHNPGARACLVNAADRVDGPKGRCYPMASY